MSHKIDGIMPDTYVIGIAFVVRKPGGDVLNFHNSTSDGATGVSTAEFGKVKPLLK